MLLNSQNVTPCSMVKNEEYWIYYVLRDLMKTFPKLILLDTGSSDNTIAVVERAVSEQTNCTVQLIEDHYTTPYQIGDGRNKLRELCTTHWMLLVDGDEIWKEDKLELLFQQDIPDSAEVVMLGAKNIEDVDGVLKLRVNDTANMDRLFSPDIRWDRTDYPFESYGLNGTFPMEKVHYVPADEVYEWHVRHTQRSSKNSQAFFREEKKDYFPYSGPYEELPPDWLDFNPGYCNPYTCS